MGNLQEVIKDRVEGKDNVKGEAKGSKSHLKKSTLSAGARTKSVCYKVNPDVYDVFQAILEARGQKANALINQWITEYVNQNGEWIGR